ncbi:MAG: rhombosortase [Planctomycetota bacterium]
MSGPRVALLERAARGRPLRSPLLAPAAVLAAALVALLPDAAEALQYDRVAIAAGEWWRVVTCHWTHLSVDHLIWDAAALGILGWLCERRDPRAFRWCLFSAACAIPLAIAIAAPELRHYRGLSGIDSALFMMLAVGIIRDASPGAAGGGASRPRARAAGLLVLLFLAKVIYEVATASTLFVDSAAAGMVPVPLAHLVGAAVGAAAPWWGSEGGRIMAKK